MQVPSTDGVVLAVHDLGGSGPPLLLAHATGFHGRTWQPVADHLADAFRVWAFDERGHGDSTAPANGNFDWRAFADDALAVVDALGLHRPAAAGHSCGGALLLMAEQQRPGTFTGMWLYEPIVWPVDPPMGPSANHPLVIQARRRRERFASKQDAYDHYSSKPLFSQLDPRALSAYVEHGFADAPGGGIELKCRREDEARTFEMAMAHDAFAHLGQVKCPVSLACGEHTDAIGPSLLALLADRLPEAEMEVFAAAGHLAPLEDPARVAAAIRVAVTPPS